LNLLTSEFIHSTKVENIDKLFSMSFPLNALEKVDNLFTEKMLSQEERVLLKSEIYLWQNDISNFLNNLKQISSHKFEEPKNELLTIYRILKNNFILAQKFIEESNLGHRDKLMDILEKRRSIVERTNNSEIYSITRRLEMNKEIGNFEYNRIHVWSFLKKNFIYNSLGLIKDDIPEVNISQEVMNSWREGNERLISNIDSIRNNIEIFIAHRYRRSRINIDGNTYSLTGTFDPFFLNNEAILDKVLLYEFSNPPSFHGNPKEYLTYNTIFGISFLNDYGYLKSKFASNIFNDRQMLERIWSISLRLANELARFKDLDVKDFAKVIYTKSIGNLLGALSIKAIFDSVLGTNSKKILLGCSEKISEWGLALSSLASERHWPLVEYQHGLNSGEFIFSDLDYNLKISKQFFPKYYVVNSLDERLFFDVPDDTHILIGGGLSLPRILKGKRRIEDINRGNIAIIPTNGDIDTNESVIRKLVTNNPQKRFLLKPHPYDLPYMSRYKKMFGDLENLELVESGIYEIYKDVMQAVFLNFTTAAYELFELGINILVLPGFEESWKWFAEYRSHFTFTRLNGNFEIPDVHNDNLNENIRNNNSENVQNLIQNELKLLLKREEIENTI